MFQNVHKTGGLSDLEKLRTTSSGDSHNIYAVIFHIFGSMGDHCKTLRPIQEIHAKWQCPMIIM